MTGERKTVVLTGGTSGVGRGVARLLAREGCALVLLCRSPERGVLLAAELLGEGAARADVVPCDLGSLASVRGAAARVLAERSRVDVLCGCAGVMPWRRRTAAEGFEEVFATNVLGHVLLSDLLEQALAERAGRIVMMGGDAHRYGSIRWDDPGLARGYHALRAGTQAALMKTMWVLALARRLSARGSPVTANVFCPGPVKSALTRDFPRVLRLGMVLFDAFAQSPEQGASGPVRLCLDPAYQGVSGLYLRSGSPAQPSAAASDEASQERLWELLHTSIASG